MSVLAAAELGIRVHIYCPEQDSPAAQVAARSFNGAYDDKDTLRAFAESVDVISYEFENIPVDTVRYLQGFKPVYPNDRLLEISQNRIREKKFLNDIGIPTTSWEPVLGSSDIDHAVRDMELEKIILKTTRLGMTAKGSWFTE